MSKRRNAEARVIALDQESHVIGAPDMCLCCSECLLMGVAESEHSFGTDPCSTRHNKQDKGSG